MTAVLFNCTILLTDLHIALVHAGRSRPSLDQRKLRRRCPRLVQQTPRCGCFIRQERPLLTNQTVPRSRKATTFGSSPFSSHQSQSLQAGGAAGPSLVSQDATFRNKREISDGIRRAVLCGPIAFPSVGMASEAFPSGWHERLSPTVA